MNDVPPWMRVNQPPQQQSWQAPRPQDTWMQSPQRPMQSQRPVQMPPQQPKEAITEATKKRKRLVYGLLGLAIFTSLLFVVTVMIFIMRYK
jgi:hypothetical protein